MDFGQALIRQLAIHKVGNKQADATLLLSGKNVELKDDTLLQLLSQYFLSSFKTEEFFHFFHGNSLQFNEVYQYVKNIFDDSSTFHENSRHIARHLYERSAHPKINPGELYVAFFEKTVLDGVERDAVGIFKSESRESYLKVYPRGDDYEVDYDEGINIHKLDKGCVVFRTEEEAGYRLCIVDNVNRSMEAQYWRDEFLKVRQVEDPYYQTEQYLKMTRQYITKELPSQYEVSAADKADLLNRSIRYFREQESFDLNDFARQVIGQEDMAQSFRDYKRDYEADAGASLAEDFQIHAQAVKKQSRVYKSILKLDRNFHIYIHGNKDMIERGYDEASGLHYYKVYFREEA